MAMKYVKLFENWLLTEGDQVEAFDASKPDMWPVMETTVGDGLKNELDEKFLTSIFRRAMAEGNRDKLKVSEAYEEETPRFAFPVMGILNKSAEDNVKLKHEGLKSAFANLEWEILSIVKSYPNPGKEEPSLSRIKATDGPKIKKIIEKYYKALTGEGNKQSAFETSTDTKKMYSRITGSTKQLFVDFCYNTLIPTLDKRVDAANSKQDRMIDFFWENEQILTVYIDKTLGNGIDKDELIMNYPCKDIRSDVDEYLPMEKKPDATAEEVVEPTENPLYKQLKSADINRISYTDFKLTFGMIMTWLNKWQNGQSNIPLLSNTGSKNYDKDCKIIFDAEEREYLADFEPTSFSMGGQKFNLANTKSNGTVVPLLAKNKVYGTVGFAFNSYEITEDGKKSLGSTELWNILVGSKGAKKSIIIVGNCDGIGSDKINDELSKQRAKAVLEIIQADKRAKQLTQNISIRGDGKRNQLVDDEKGKNKKNAALNRRVEIIIDGIEASDILKGQL